MKLKYSSLLFLVILALTTTAVVSRSPEKGLVVHEWGSFTSFQAGDGIPLSWKPLVTSALPGFVYNWNRPGLPRINFGLLAGKGSMSSLQRMETPVVYFYSDKELTADVSVQFPLGIVTEWFPQAPEIGPSCGPAPELTITNSIIHWPNIHVLPKDSSASALVPMDTNGTHYFAARGTDANLLRVDSLSPTNPQPQYEKFLFYRGLGNFLTPLRVTMKSDDAVTLANTGKEPLTHLFVLDVKDKSGGFVYVAQLLPGEEKTVPRTSADRFLAPEKLTTSISREMSKALVKEGLYPREATAMVNTWKSSWFAEDGTRVFYILPRAWTDHTLPMSLNPQPKELTRVMVGRAEVLTPALEQNLIGQLDKIRQGEHLDMVQLHATAMRLGRFAEPAYFHALAKIKTRPEDLGKMARAFFANDTSWLDGSGKPASEFE